jgi:N-hydroxyarylamine O-acetyltransferase
MFWRGKTIPRAWVLAPSTHLVGRMSNPTTVDVAAYLSRIGYSGSTEPTADVLREIHRAHMVSVPFENLDIALRRKIVLDSDAFVRKIVGERRGGFCYELNGAFAALLEALGFRVTLLSARVPRQDGTETPEFDHLTLRVDLEEPWLADVGFGDFVLEPLRLQTVIEQRQDAGVFRIDKHGDDLHVEKLQANGTQVAQYRFTLQPRRLEEFKGMCHFHQTSPESPFTRKSLCSLATPNGRITVSDLKFIESNNGTRRERVLGSEEEWKRVLRDKFGVVLQDERRFSDREKAGLSLRSS